MRSRVPAGIKHTYLYVIAAAHSKRALWGHGVGIRVAPARAEGYARPEGLFAGIHSCLGRRVERGLPYALALGIGEGGVMWVWAPEPCRLPHFCRSEGFHKLRPVRLVLHLRDGLGAGRPVYHLQVSGAWCQRREVLAGRPPVRRSAARVAGRGWTVGA